MTKISDDDLNYEKLDKLLKNQNEISKNSFILEIERMGDKYLNEIDEKRKNSDIKKRGLIDEIISKSDKYSLDYLSDLDYKSVLLIYDDIKEQTKPLMKKILEYIFGIR